MREITLFNHNWLFKGPKGQSVSLDLPHTVNAVDGQDGGNDYFRGTVTYTKVFEIPGLDLLQNHYYLEVNGANSSATVFLNDRKLAEHHGGYSTFRVFLNPALDEYNTLRIDVDNSPNDRVYPQKADFTFYNGIYRDVNLICVKPHHFELEAYGTPGMKVTPGIEGQDAWVDVETLTVDGSGEIKLTIRDREGQIVAQATSRNRRQQLKIENVHLWQGRIDPYLYEVEATLLLDGEVQDEIRQHFGVRSFSVDPEKGFFLNGESYPLRGVSRHQDREGVGNALSRADHEQDMALILEVGANAIRLAHYQHDQYFYDLCDKHGLVVWAEIPYISEHMPNGRENTLSQMTELITQNYNHASIMMWGISNEITISTKDRNSMLANHHALIDLVKQLDPTRLTTLAAYAMASPFNRVNHLTDLLGYNLYLGWYVPGLFLNDLFLKMFHLIYPRTPLAYTEYGAEGLTHLHSEKPRRADHTEEYQAIYHEYMIECFARHPFMWGTYVWNMFDFGCDNRNQGGVPGRNHKGLISFDRTVKKDSFYLYKVYWNPEPMIHICSKRFTDRAQDKIEVKVYSNQPEVTLFQNGTKVGTKRAADGQKIFCFEVALAKENKIEAFAGDLSDEAHFRRVAEPNPTYTLAANLRKSSNWVNKG